MKKFLKVLAVSLVFVMMLGVLVSCAPAKDPDDAVAALKDNGYSAQKSDALATAGLALAGIKDVESVVMGEKYDKETKKVDAVMIIYFEDSAAAKEAWENAEKYLNEAIEDMKEEDKDAEFTVAKSGAMIYAGTKDAIKAAR